jgi:outer membrane lipoprotein-sorting protein
MPVLSARTRWLVPVVAAGAVAATGGALALAASAAPSLPPKSAGQLLTDVQRANLVPFSGTVVQTASLGLPALPTQGKGSDLTNLVSGSNTLRIWYGGPTRTRVALLGMLGETDVIRNGRDVWSWDSENNAYTHNTLSGEAKPEPKIPTGTTPQQAAQDALALIGKTTTVSTDGTAQVAHRKAYELVLAPKDTRSLVAQVRIAVDAERSVPLRVQVFAKNVGKPAFEVGFTQVSFTAPGDEQFRFTPPKGSHQEKSALPGGRVPVDPSQLDPASPSQRGSAVEQASKVIGEGWTRVAILPVPQSTLSRSPLGAVLDGLPAVSGTWGRGRLFTGPLFSVVFTTDGRMAVGAVSPELIYQALATK